MSRNHFPPTVLLAVAACLLWSTAFVAIKVGLRYSGPFSFAGLRFMLSGVMLVPFWWGRRPAPDRLCTHGRLLLAVAFFQTFVLYGLFYLGMTLISGALAAMVVGTSPLVAAVLAHYCMAGDRLTPSRSAGLLLGLVGVAILSVSRLPWASPSGLRELVGILVLLLSQVGGAVGNILVARHRADLDPVFLNSAQIFIGGLALWLVSLPLENQPTPALPWPYFAALGWLAFLSAAAFSIWFLLLRRPGVRVSEINIWKFLIPVCGALLSWLLLPEEGPSPWPVVGMLCIAGAIILFNLPGRQRFRSRQPFS